MLVKSEQVNIVIEEIIKDDGNKTFENEDATRMISEFKLHFKYTEELDSYEVTESELLVFVNKLSKTLWNESLMDLVNMGLVEMSYSNETNDFVFWKKGTNENY